MRARYYNPQIKRFINRDILDGSIDNTQSLNKYCYVQGNPITLTDPFGLCPDLGGILADFFGDLWNDHFVLGVLSGIPGFGIPAAIRNIQLYDMEGDHYNKILAEIALVANIGMTAAIIGIYVPLVATGAGIVATTCIATSICAGVAVTGYNFGNKLSYAIDDMVETGQVSAQTKGAIKSAGLDFGLTFAGGIAGAGAIDDAMRVAKAGRSVKFSGGSKSGNYSSLRDLMSPEEIARYDEHWNVVADDMLKSNLSNFRNGILNGDITKTTGGKINSKVMTAAIDIETGDIYYGISGMNNNPTRNTINSQMQSILNSVDGTMTNYPLENCGEFNAINNALNNGVDINMLRVYSIERVSGNYKAPCINCQNLYGNLVHFTE